MASTIIIKNSSTPSAVPTTAQLVLGELAINTFDGKLFTKQDSGVPTIIEIGGPTATTLTGDVTGTGIGTIPATLAASGVVAGTYTKVTVNAKGLVTVGSSLSSSDVTTALGYTPVNIAGDTMTGLLTLSGDPVSSLQAATKQYVDNAINGLYWKNAALAATTANITLSAPQTIDGVSLVAGDRVLVKDQTLTEENGIYIVAAGAWARSADANSASELNAAAISVIEGTVNAGTSWVQTSVVVTLGTDPVTFVQFSGPGAYTAGTGLQLLGNQFSIPTSGVTAGTYNNVTVNNLGITTAGSNVAYLTSNQTITLSGDVTGTGTTAITATLVNSGITAGTYAGITFDSRGIATTATNTIDGGTY